MSATFMTPSQGEIGSQWALLHRSSEKNWQLLTKFTINSHLTVEEKICHKK
ncbi:hypothetical protein [Wolbachia endosymbiont of Glossina morsitans morsitans]|uniref:hypothetical protein n=1 Tax=Wolbachia endosymbiont of Glossina morsitans morsitans TaxID=1150948 RepID=UPI001F11F211|nr:hypothetical protein [Wolbachia endosymbiont of Glossina morsitans morsitans]